MKRTIAILAISLMLLTMIANAEAKTDQGTLSAKLAFQERFRKFNFNFNITISISYDINYQSTYQDSIARGSSENFRISLQNGHINASIRAPGINSTFDKSAKLGEQIRIDLTGGVSLLLMLKAESDVIVNGSGSADTNKITFDNEGEQIFKLRIDNAARIGDEVKVTLRFKLRILIGFQYGSLNIPFEEVASKEMEPTLSYKITVAPTFLDQYLIPIIIAVVIAIILVTAAFLIIRSRRKAQASQ